MTETDNPEVKEHLQLKTGQLLKRIEELDDNTREFQKMFESREIKPVVIIGTYDKNTKYYDLANGQLDTDAHTITTDTTSAAATTWTVTTGKKWIIHAILSSNSTRATGTSLSIGGTVRNKSSTAIGAQSVSYQMVGYTAYSIPPGLVVSAGTAIVVTDLAFQAGDTMSKTIVYREVDA